MAFPVLLIAAAAAAQPSQPPPSDIPRHWDSRPSGGGVGRAFLSPMGEPFFGRTAGEDGLVAWFEQADRNHDGAITADEMTADAARFFQTLDTNQDGEIDPDEIAHYEEVIAPEVRTGPHPMPDMQAGGDIGTGRGDYGGGRHGGGGGHRGGGHRGGGSFHAGGGGDFGPNDEASAGRFGLLEIPEPVSSADADFNRGVSAQEFSKAAEQRFQLLDLDHTGRLTLPELQSIRAAAAANARRPPPQPASEDHDSSDSDDPEMQ